MDGIAHCLLRRKPIFFFVEGYLGDEFVTAMKIASLDLPCAPDAAGYSLGEVAPMG
jgi:hypothetical protein